MKRSNRFWNQRLKESYLGSLLLRFINYIVHLFQNSFLGNFLRSDERTDVTLEASAIHGGLELAQFDQRVIIPAKRRLLNDSENSRLLGIFRAFLTTFLRTPAKVYGFFLFSAGFFTIIFSGVTHFYETADADFIQKLFVGSSCVILSFPFFRLEEPLHLTIRNSFLLSSFFHDFCGVPRSDLSVYTFPFQEYLALLLGLGFGGLLSFLGYKFVLSTLLFFIFFSLTVTKPEVGTILCLFLLTMIPAKFLAVLLIITTAAFLGKTLIGKRAIHPSVLDLSILSLVLILVLSTVIGVAGFLPSHFISLIVFLSIYFLVSNLLDRAEWLIRGINALLLGISIAAFLGVLEYITGHASTSWQDATLFSDLFGRAGSTLGNPNLLASVLTLALPLTLSYALHNTWKRRHRIFACIGFLLCSSCLVLTWSRGGWIGALTAILVFCLLYTRKTWIAIICALAVSPFLSLLLPDMVFRRLVSIFNLADSSTSYRLQIWKQSLHMIKDHLFGGIGYGEESFTEMAAHYPIPGLTAEAHAHSLYLQLILSCGVFVILLFLIFVVLFTRKILTFHKNHHDSTKFPYSSMACAAFSGVFGFLVQGFTDHTWYSYRVYCVFWAIVGIAIAAVHACKYHTHYTADAQSTYTIDLL